MTNIEKPTGDEEFDYLDKSNISFSLNQTNELFDEEAALKKHPTIGVRRVSLPKNGENWEILENNKKVLVIPGTRLTKKEREILRTVDGIMMLMAEYKAGARSVAKLKSKLKKYKK